MDCYKTFRNCSHLYHCKYNRVNFVLTFSFRYGQVQSGTGTGYSTVQYLYLTLCGRTKNVYSNISYTGCPKKNAFIRFWAITHLLDFQNWHMIPFWNPWDLANAQEVHLDLLVTIRMVRKLRNVLQLGFLSPSRHPKSTKTPVGWHSWVSWSSLWWPKGLGGLPVHWQGPKDSKKVSYVNFGSLINEL